jgi:selenide,water dikinase
MFDPADYPDLLVGLAAPDDAAVWRLDDERALVVTTDFFTPVVDSPYDFGAIAAANSLSDIYAMGGQPFMALNVAALPPDLPAEISSEILRGGAQKCREAGVILAGGHTVQDREPKYGLVAVGFVHPARMITKGGAQPGDALVLTKPLGFGVTATALKRDQAAAADVDEMVDWMSRLNREAARLAAEFSLRGGTDITGFGLLGHGLEMADSSTVEIIIRAADVPFLQGARRYAQMGAFAAGSLDNQHFFGPRVGFDAPLDEPSRLLLFDAQTSGGLLLAVPQEKLPRLLERAARVSQPAWSVGVVNEGAGLRIV